jgi:hypothetical protein
MHGSSDTNMPQDQRESARSPVAAFPAKPTAAAASSGGAKTADAPAGDDKLSQLIRPSHSSGGPTAGLLAKTRELLQRFRDTPGDSLKERWVGVLGRGEGGAAGQHSASSTSMKRIAGCADRGGAHFPAAGLVAKTDMMLQGSQTAATFLPMHPHPGTYMRHGVSFDSMMAPAHAYSTPVGRAAGRGPHAKFATVAHATSSHAPLFHPQDIRLSLAVTCHIFRVNILERSRWAPSQTDNQSLASFALLLFAPKHGCKTSSARTRTSKRRTNTSSG